MSCKSEVVSCVLGDAIILLTNHCHSNKQQCLTMRGYCVLCVIIDKQIIANLVK